MYAEEEQCKCVIMVIYRKFVWATREHAFSLVMKVRWLGSNFAVAILRTLVIVSISPVRVIIPIVPVWGTVPVVYRAWRMMWSGASSPVIVIIIGSIHGVEPVIWEYYVRLTLKRMRKTKSIIIHQVIKLKSIHLVFIV